MISCRTSFQQVALKVAALLLVLHWTAPSLQPFQPDPQPGDSTPVYSRADVGTPQGTLPRTSARIQTLDAGEPKAPHDVWPSSGKLAALKPAQTTGTLLPIAAEPSAHHEWRIAIAAHAFEARGPPSI